MVGLLLPALASADRITFTYEEGAEGVPLASGALASGPYVIQFDEGPQITGTVERGGTAIASGTPQDNRAVDLSATLQPGDVAILHDPSLPGGELSATFSGYPTINAVSCGSVTVTGATAPGQRVEGVKWGFRGAGGEQTFAIANAGGTYSATFKKPIPPGALITAETFVYQPPFELDIETKAKSLGPCVAPPPAPNPTPLPSHTTSHHVAPKTIAQCKKRYPKRGKARTACIRRVGRKRPQ